MRRKINRKRAGSALAATAVAAVTAAGVLVGGAYASPEELLNDGPDAIVQTLDMNAPLDNGGADDGGGEEEAEGEEEKRGIYSGVRRLMRAAPAGVRALVGIPLWGLGTVLTALLSALWSGVLSPAASTLLSWLAMALMTVLIFTLAVKTAFPDLPLRKILNRRSLAGIGILCLLFGIADAALPLFWEDYRQLSRLLRIAGSLVCTGVPVAFFVRRHARKKPAEVVVGEAAEPAPSLADRERAAKKLVAELADSVCPRLY